MTFFVLLLQWYKHRGSNGSHFVLDPIVDMGARSIVDIWGLKLTQLRLNYFNSTNESITDFYRLIL